MKAALLLVLLVLLGCESTPERDPYLGNEFSYREYAHPHIGPYILWSLEQARKDREE